PVLDDGEVLKGSDELSGVGVQDAGGEGAAGIGVFRYEQCPGDHAAMRPLGDTLVRFGKPVSAVDWRSFSCASSTTSGDPVNAPTGRGQPPAPAAPAAGSQACSVPAGGPSGWSRATRDRCPFVSTCIFGPEPGFSGPPDMSVGG